MDSPYEPCYATLLGLDVLRVIIKYIPKNLVYRLWNAGKIFRTLIAEQYTTKLRFSNAYLNGNIRESYRIWDRYVGIQSLLIQVTPTRNYPCWHLITQQWYKYGIDMKNSDRILWKLYINKLALHTENCNEHHSFRKKICYIRDIINCTLTPETVSNQELWSIISYLLRYKYIVIFYALMGRNYTLLNWIRRDIWADMSMGVFIYRYGAFLDEQDLQYVQ